MKNILIFCGGMSAEHEISIISARNVIKAIDKSLFNPLIVIISRSGTWYAMDDSSLLEKIEKCEEPFNYGKICTLIRKMNETYLISLNSSDLIKIDAAFPLIHGPMGEDGTLQGMLEVMNLPYVGSGVLSSALGMDKIYQKKIFESENIPIVPYISLSSQEELIDYETASLRLDSKKLFIKPAIMGSSVGVHKVTSQEEYKLAIEQAFKYSFKILIEKFIPCREVECAVLGNKTPKSSPIGEIKPTHEFYSYEAKYLDPNGAELIIPAVLQEETAHKIKHLAIEAYKSLECLGLARVDFFISENEEIYINEVNTIPGFTSISMYPKLWEYAGINYSSLITQLLNFAFEIHLEKQKICLSPDIKEEVTSSTKKAG